MLILWFSLIVTLYCACYDEIKLTQDFKICSSHADSLPDSLSVSVSQLLSLQESRWHRLAAELENCSLTEKQMLIAALQAHVHTEVGALPRATPQQVTPPPQVASPLRATPPPRATPSPQVKSPWSSPQPTQQQQQQQEADQNQHRTAALQAQMQTMLQRCVADCYCCMLFNRTRSIASLLPVASSDCWCPGWNSSACQCMRWILNSDVQDNSYCNITVQLEHSYEPWGI